MKIFRIGVAALIFAGLAACSSKDSAGPEIIDLTGEIIPFEQEALIARAISISRRGDFLAVVDIKSDSVAHLFSLNPVRYHGQFGPKGQGPGEFDGVTMVGTMKGSHPAFTVYQPHRGVLCSLTVTPESGQIKLDTLTVLKNAWTIEEIPSMGYITTNGYVNYPELFAVFDKEGREVRHCGDRQIPDEYKDLDPVQTTAAFQYGLTVSPDGTRVAAVSASGEAAGFYRVEGDSLILVSQFYNSAARPDYHFQDGQYLGQQGETPNGFLTRASDNDNVYILWSELPFKNDSVGRSFTGDRILVYNWDGEKTGEYRLDRRVKVITAPTPDDRSIIAITEDDCEPTLVRFPLPD